MIQRNKEKKPCSIEYFDETYKFCITKCNDILLRLCDDTMNRNKEADLNDACICLNRLLTVDYFMHMYRNNKIIKELGLRLINVLFKQSYDLKNRSIVILEALLHLDFNKYNRKYINPSDRVLYRKLLSSILPEVNGLAKNVQQGDKPEYLDKLTNVIIWLFETIPINELKEAGTVSIVLEDFVNKCPLFNLCAKVLAGMSINFFESVEKNPFEVVNKTAEELLRKFNEENDFLVYVYSKFSEKLLELLRMNDNQLFRKDVTYGLLNITYYANKKMKQHSELSPNSDKSLKSKMRTINKVAITFLEDEINKPEKQDLFMVKYFFSIIHEHLKIFNGHEMDVVLNELMTILIRTISLCGIVFPKTLQHNTYLVIQALIEKCGKLNIAHFEELQPFWFKSIKNLESSAFSIVSKMFQRPDIEGLYPYSKKIVQVLAECFEENMNAENPKALSHTTEAVVCLVKYYNDRRMLKEFQEDGLVELLRKYNRFMKNSLLDNCKFKYYIDFYSKLFSSVSFFLVLNIWTFHINDILIFFESVTNGTTNLDAKVDQRFYGSCDTLLFTLNLGFSCHMQQYSPIYIDFLNNLKARIIKTEELSEDQMDF